MNRSSAQPVKRHQKSVIAGLAAVRAQPDEREWLFVPLPTRAREFVAAASRATDLILKVFVWQLFSVEGYG